MSEPIYPPTPPRGSVTFLTDTGPVTAPAVSWSFNPGGILDEPEPAVVDDSPAALIARLTAWDTGGE